MKINKKLSVVLVLLIIILINYVNIFTNDFAWDDSFFIVNNIHIKDIKNIPGFFAEPSPGNLYRPLRSVFYTINYQIWLLNVFGYHLNSLILHFFVTILIFLITLKITNKTGFSFITSLFFAAHPIHTARVTNMTGTFDIFGILFMLLALFFYILFSQKKKNNFYILSIILYFLAIFSSEEAITLVLILFLYDLSFNYKIDLTNIKLLTKKYMPYIAITIFYLIIRFIVLGQVGRGEGYFHHGFFGTLLTTIKIFVNYIFLLIFPMNLVTEYYIKFETTILSIYFLTSLLVLSVILLFFIRSYKKSKIIFFSVGWFFITLLPFSNILPQVTIMADRYLYLPSFGFCLLLAFTISSIKKINFLKKYSKIIILVLIILITVGYTLLTIQRNAEWKDNFTLYSKDLEKNPFGTKLNEGLALEYKKNRDYDNAIRHGLVAVQLSKKNYKAYEILGTSYAQKKEYGKAILLYNKAIEINPNFYLAYDNLGLVYSYMNDFNNSISYLKKAIDINPKLSKAYNDIGTAYAQIGEFDKAIENINKAIERNPYEESYYQNLAIIQEFVENR